MAFSLPFNGDLGLLQALPAANPLDSSSVTRVYGMEDSSPIGGGRSSQHQAVSADVLRAAIACCHKKGIKFDYTMNAATLAGKECTPEGRAELSAKLDWVRSLGADLVIFAVPYLLLLSKERDPDYPVGISRFVATNGMQRLRKLIEMRADRVCLDLRVTRDFKQLEHMAQAFPGRLQLLVNDACAFDCPRQYEHALASTYASIDKRSQGYYSFCTLWCIWQALKNPAEIIMSAFVRPEDLKHYRAVGIDHFKLTDRNKPTAWIRNMLKAYQQEHYQGNLADLLGLLSPFGLDILSIEEARREANREMRSAKDLRRAGSLIPAIADVQVDNQALSGYLDRFMESRCDRSCPQRCTACHEWAERAVHIDPERKRLAIQLLEKVNRVCISSPAAPALAQIAPVSPSGQSLPPD